MQNILRISYLILILFFQNALATSQLSNITIKSCPCDASCYTNEISNLKCDNRYAEFDSKGMPNASHEIMTGITRSNQQFPLDQPYNAANNNAIRIILNPEQSSRKTATEIGAIGIAVNGVPIFDPRTQNKNHDTHTLDVGELDPCGGHAGRGDDYHYHVAPTCLINQLGEDKIENQKLPIGYAKDGYSIHALGWFNKNNDIENYLDECRGIFDANGQYFYNVKNEYKWDVFNCYNGIPRNTGPKGSVLRRGSNGDALSGSKGFKGMIPIKFSIEQYYRQNHQGQTCYFAVGEISERNLVNSNGQVVKNYHDHGTIFYCNSNCYGHFFEASTQNVRGRAIKYDLVTKRCPSSLNLKQIQLFDN